MGFEVYIWIILMLLILTALGAKVLTTRLLSMQKRRYVSLQAKKQGLAQRQVAVQKRLESMRNTREMMARRKERLADEVAQLRNQGDEVDSRVGSDHLEAGDETEVVAEDAVEVVTETADEQDQDIPDDISSDPDSRKIKNQFNRKASLYEEDKPREIKTYLDKIRDTKDKDDPK